MSDEPVRLVAASPLPLSAEGQARLQSELGRLTSAPARSLAAAAHLIRLGIRQPALLQQIGPGPRVEEQDAIILTSNGPKFALSRERTGAGEWHPAQVLSALGEAGVPASHEFVTGQRPVRIAELVEECAASFTFEEELEWRTVALALYRPQVREWKTAAGEIVSFDAITQEALRRLRTRGSGPFFCSGTHTPYVLTVLLRVDGIHPLWFEREFRRRTEEALLDASRRLEEGQFADGSWDNHWELPALTRRGTRMKLTDRLLVTGHHLEWLALAPEELRPPRAVLLAAGDFVLRTVAELRDEELSKRFCPVTHGLRAFVLSEAVRNDVDTGEEVTGRDREQVVSAIQAEAFHVR